MSTEDETPPTPEDLRALRRDKYGDNPGADLTGDIARLASGEPLAYVIGWVPFLGLKIGLDSCPLIPRPETEWWTANLIEHLAARFKDAPFTFLDLCAGSGAIGLSVLAKFPRAEVHFSELIPEHAALVRKNVEGNGLDASRARIHTGDLFAQLSGLTFDAIATNPPYVPESRVLPESVTGFEPAVALYAGADGLSLIRQIATDAPKHLRLAGELWLECDIAHAEEAVALIREAGAKESALHTDQYGRPRLVVSYW
ncbi:MAG TPA: HemK/PrmC family methyltransferase [Candidatus Paceibacterota bacterium]|jgi:release factor glutamine methyltransferase